MSLFNRNAIPEDLLLDRYMHDIAPKATRWKIGQYPGRRDKGSAGRKKRASRSKSKSQEPEPDFEEDWSLLNSFSLIRTDVSSTHFSMHNLVQVATRRWLDMHAQLPIWNRNFIFLMDDAYPNINTDSTDYTVLSKKCDSLLPHAQAASQCQPPDKETLIVWANLLVKIGEYAYNLRAWSYGIEVLGTACIVLELFHGKCDDWTLQSMRRMGEMLVFEKRLDDGERQYRTVMERKKESLGATHLETLDAMDQLSEVLNEQGRYEEADALYESAMAIRERKYGLRDPATQLSVEKRVIFLGGRGRYEEAEREARRAFSARQQEIGDEVYDGMWCLDMEIMAQTLHTFRGNSKDAARILQEILEHKEQTLEKDDSRTLHTVVLLAAVYLGQEKYADAEVLYKRALSGDHEGEIMELSPKCELAWCLLKQRKFEEAESFTKTLLQESIKELGRGNRDTAFATSILAGVFHGEKRFEEAIQHAAEALATARELVGDSHPDTQDFAHQLEEIKRDMDAEGQ